LAAGLFFATTAVAESGEMSVATFLAKADALKAKGILAVGSSEIGLLQAEAKASGANYRNRPNADSAAS